MAITQLATHMVAKQAGAQAVIEVIVKLGFGPPKQGILLAVLNHPIIRAGTCAGIGTVDVVLDAVLEQGQVKGDLAQSFVQAQIHVIGGFFFQARVADFHGPAGGMRAKGIQLFGRRQALRAGHRGGNLIIRAPLPDRAQRQRGSRMSAVFLLGFNVNGLPFVAQAQFVTPVAVLVFLQHKQGVVVGQAVGHIGFFTRGLEVATQGLAAQHAPPAP